VEQPAETVDSLDTVPALEALRGRVGDRNLEVDPAVRALVVVVTDELPEHPVEMAFPSDEHPVEALGPGRADKALRERPSWDYERSLPAVGSSTSPHRPGPERSDVKRTLCRRNRSGYGYRAGHDGEAHHATGGRLFAVHQISAGVGVMSPGRGSGRHSWRTAAARLYSAGLPGLPDLASSDAPDGLPNRSLPLSRHSSPRSPRAAPIVARYAGSGPMSWAGYLRVSSRSTWMPPTSEGQVDPEPVRLARLRANGLSL
jgi:hypothetical protein